MVEVLIHKNLAQKLKDWGPRKVGSVLILFVLVFGFGVTYFELQHQQDIRQRAAENNLPKNAKYEKLKKIGLERVKAYSSTEQVKGLLVNMDFHKENKEKTSKSLDEILKQRKDTLVALLPDDPQQVQDDLLSGEQLQTAQDVSPSNVEKKVLITGVYSILHIHGDDFDNPETTSFTNILTVGENQYNVYSANTLSGMKPGDTITVDGYQLGDTILASSVKVQKSAQVQGASTTTQINIAVIGTRFTDTPTTADRTYTLADLTKIFNGDPANDVIDYFNEVSYGKFTVAAQYYGIYTLPFTHNAGCLDNQLKEKIVAQADPDINYSEFNRIILVMDCAGYYAGSFNNITTADGTFPQIKFVGANSFGIKDSDMPSVISHELSHTLALGTGMMDHANFYSCQPDIFIAPNNLGSNLGTGCTSEQYGDAFDILGQSGLFGHLDAYHKFKSGMFGAGNYQTVTTSGIFTLAPIETNSDAAQGLYIPRGVTGEGFTIEYRQPIGYDAKFTNPVLCPGCTVTQGPSIKYIHAQATGDTQALDMVPYNAAAHGSDYMNGAALTPGNTFTDPEYGTSIKTLSADSTGTTVQITFPSSASCVHNPPTATISPSLQTVSSRQTVDYAITVTNNDSSTCPTNTFGIVKNKLYGIENNFSYLFNPSFVSLAPGATGIINLKLTGNGTMTDGLYSQSLGVYSNIVGIAPAQVYASYKLVSPPDISPPTTPNNFTVSTPGSFVANLSWEPSTDDMGVAGYTLTRDGSNIATVPADQTSFINSTLVQNTAYTYSIQAYDQKGNVSSPSALTVTTPARTDYAYPTCGSNTSENGVTNANTAHLKWSLASANKGIGGYWLYRDNNIYKTLDPLKTSFDDTGLGFYNALYTYYMYVFDVDGNQTGCDFPNNFYFYTASEGQVPPKQPVNLQVSAIPNQTHLTWDASTETDITKYNIYQNGVFIASSTSNYFDDYSVFGNTSYIYSVQAVDSMGNLSPRSTTAYVIVPPGPTNTPTPTSAVLPTATPTIALPSPTPTSVLLPTPTPTPTPTPLPTVPPLDTIAPSVTITSPLNGVILKKNTTITLSANATDNVGVSKVEFYITNKLGCPADTTAPYSCSWKIPAKSGATYIIIAKAYDAAGNTTISSVTVTAK